MKTARGCLSTLLLALLCGLLPAPAFPQSVTEESPFLWFGKPYLANPPQVSIHVKERYGDVPLRFPTAASCGYAPTLEDERLRPAIVTDKEEFEVCLFRVIARLRSLPEIHAWMVRTGWRLRESRTMLPDEGRSYGADTPLQSRIYVWDIEANGVPFGRERLFEVRYAVTVSIVHSESRGPLEVTSSSYHIWSK